MENQEIPKKLTPEEIEKQEKNLEQQDEKAEQPIEQDDSDSLYDVNEKITKKEENIESTQNNINDIRNSLGLPPSDEIPPSIKGDKDALEKLTQEKAKLDGKDTPISDQMSEILKQKREISSKAESIEKNGKKFFKFKSKEDQNEYERLNKQFHSLLDKDDTGEKDKEFGNEKPEEIKLFEKNLKGVIDNISSDSKTMLDALNERQENRLTPIQSNDQFRMMASNIRNLKNFESKIDLESISEITASIGKLSRMFDEFRIQQTSQMKENPENLEKLAFGAKRFSGSVQENFRKLPIEMEDKQMEAKSKELRLAMQKLSEQSQKLWMFAVKMRENSR